MMKPVRLLPLLAVAAVCLVMLKFAGLLLGGGYIFSGSAPAGAQAEEPQPASGPAAKEREPEQEKAAAAQADDAGSEPPAETADADPAGEPENGGKAAPAAGNRQEANAAVPQAPAEDPAARKPPSAGAPVGAEKDILVSLAERGKQLEARARELELRENLIKVAEKHVETRIRELKEIEKRIDIRLTRREKEQDAEYEKLVALYAKMKPKDAARIFEQMDVSVLAGLIRRMNARTVSPILAEMDPEVAKRVTMEIAFSNKGPASPMRSLPKIKGKNPG